MKWPRNEFKKGKKNKKRPITNLMKKNIGQRKI